MNHDFIIREICSGKKRYINLLLIGDEQEDMIERYLDRCRLFIGFSDGLPVACIAVCKESADSVEIKNLAVSLAFRRRGIGRMMIRYVEMQYPDCTILLGTGETPSTLEFYRKCGFSYYCRIPDFFTNNYNHPIVEEEVMLKDMIYLRKNHTTPNP